MSANVRAAALVAAALILGVAGLLVIPRLATGPAPLPTPTAIPSSPAVGASGGTDCEDGTTGCAGQLAAGDHGSAQFSIPITFTTPDGWTNVRDIGRSYSLETTAGLAGFMEVLTNVAIADPDGCTRVPAPGVGNSVQAIVDYLRSLPGLVASEPVPTVVGGYHGQTVDFAIASSWTHHCPDLDPTDPFITMLTDTGTPPERLLGYTTNQRVRWTILDVGGRTVIVAIEGPPAQGQFEAAVAADQPIVDSLRFSPTP